MSRIRSRRRGAGFFVSCLAAAALLAGAAAWTHRSADRTSGASALTNTAENGSNRARDLRVEAQPTVPVRQWKAGESYTYAYKNTRTFGMRERAQANGKGFRLVVEGALVLTVVGTDEHAVHLQAELRGAHMSSEGAPMPIDDVTALSRPFFVTLARDGRIDVFHFSKSVDGETRNHLKEVIASMQFAAPAQPELVAWQANEQDAAGEYVAAYACDGTLPTVKKSKLRYVRVQSAKGLVPAAEIGSYEVTSNGAFTLADHGWPRSVDDEEAVVVTFTGQKSEFVMQSKTSATLDVAAFSPELIGALDRAASDLDTRSFDNADQLAAARAKLDVNRVAGATFATMMGDLKALSPKSKDDEKRAHRLLTRVSALLRVHPEDAAEAKAALLREPAGMARRTLIGALGGAGTPEAQKALAEILATNDAPLETRVGATTALGLSAHATKDAMAATEKAIDAKEPELHTSGALALGNQIRESNTDPAATDALTDLIARLEAATTTEEKILYLNALGNTGDLRALPELQKFLADPMSAIRGAAVGGLRFIPGTDVDALVSGVMLSDSDPSVRVAALTAITFRSIDAFGDALFAALRVDPSKTVRSRVLGLLVQHGQQLAGTRDAIAWTAAHDADADMRAAAAAALGNATPAN